MGIGHGSNLGIKGLRNLGILSILIYWFYPLIAFNPSMPKSLNLALIDINSIQKKDLFFYHFTKSVNTGNGQYSIINHHSSIVIPKGIVS